MERKWVEMNVSSHKERFNSEDRRRVICWIEDHHGVTLHQVGRRPKWLRDCLGKNWCVMGGVGYWHGIPEEIVNSEKNSQAEGVLILVAKKSSKLEAFSGELRNIAKFSDKLYRNKDGDYQFDCRARGARLLVRGLGSEAVMVLDRIFEIPQ